MKQIEFFFWGTLAAFGALVAETFLSYVLPEFFPKLIVFQESNMYYFLIMAAVVEEIFKYSVLNYKRKEINEWKNLILRIIFIGLGFSSFEIFANFWKINFASGLFPIISALEIILIHLFTVFTAGVLLVKFKNKYKFLPIIFIMSAMHFIFNAMIEFELNNFKILSFLAVLFAINFMLFAGLKRKGLPLHQPGAF
jgi:hypothetical protein